MSNTVKWSLERSARAGLAAVYESGNPQVAALIADNSAQSVWDALLAGTETAAAARAHQVDVQQLEAKTAALGLRFVIPGDDEWPVQLSSLAGVAADQMGGEPFGLWCAGPGDLATWTVGSVAVVGSRAATNYGELATAALIGTLAETTSNHPGRTIVSGGAFGIDAAAHRAALAVEGRTIAVLANGLDICYPRGNQRLFDELAATQLLVSELPPGRTPRREWFLSRNRLIAALGLGTIVVEAGHRSGARNTAAWANRLNRILMAVPGSILSANSEGPNTLIHDGDAVLVATPEQVESLLGQLGGHIQPPLEILEPETGIIDQDVLAFLPQRGHRTTDELAARSQLPIRECLASLARLSAAGLIVADEWGRWSRAKAT
jgi:DNA processing protein